MGDSASRRAPAKVNLALAVGPAEACNGEARHPICSWMVRVSLYDDLTVARLPAGSLSRYALIWAQDALHQPDIDWPIRKDLAVRAHLLLREAVGRDLPLQMKIEKRIPLGSGLGGGSSDAAAMLLACNELFDLRLPIEQLQELASRLGSDVPFFLRHRSAVIEGFGETIAASGELAELHLVLCLPGYGCATGEVYRLFDADAPSRGEFEAAARRVRGMAERHRVHGEAPFNDLARAAFRLQPRLETLAVSLAEVSERAVHVTGSGSTLFVVCDNEMESCALARTASQTLGSPALAVGLGMGVAPSANAD